MLSKIFKLFSSNKSTNKNNAQELSIKPSESSNLYTTSGFDDVVDGLQFSPTFQLRTPCEILRSNGMCVESEEQIPDFLNDQQNGIWLPKLKNEYSFDDNKDVGASDAYGAKRDDYVAYVCSIKGIYSGGGSIFERVSLIEKYREEHQDLLYVENKLLEYYNNYDSIIDVLMFKIDFSFEDLVLLHYRSKGYLKQVFGINTRIENSLTNAGYETAGDIICVSKEQLIKLDAIGSKSADKILDKIEEVKALTNTHISIT